MRKRFGVGDGGFIDLGLAGFFGSRPDELVFVLEVGVGFSDTDIADVYVWVSVYRSRGWDDKGTSRVLGAIEGGIGEGMQRLSCERPE